MPSGKVYGLPKTRSDFEYEQDIQDEDIPSTIARDTEVAGAIAQHVLDETHGGGHDQQHGVTSSDHTASGLTAGHVLRAASATTFGFAAIQDADLPSTIARDSEVSGAVTSHEGASDPHTGYLKESEVSGFAAPNLTLGTANAAGSATTGVRSDASVAVFDATVPATQAFGDSAATGAATVAARRDHRHAMPANPVTAHESAGDPHTGYLQESVVSGFAAPALTLGTSNAAGTGTTAIRSGASVAIFDATAPSTQAYADAAATGSAAVAARRDHKHAMPAKQITVSASAPGSPATNDLWLDIS